MADRTGAARGTGRGRADGPTIEFPLERGPAPLLGGFLQFFVGVCRNRKGNFVQEWQIIDAVTEKSRFLKAQSQVGQELLGFGHFSGSECRRTFDHSGANSLVIHDHVGCNHILDS